MTPRTWRPTRSSRRSNAGTTGRSTTRRPGCSRSPPTRDGDASAGSDGPRLVADPPDRPDRPTTAGWDPDLVAAIRTLPNRQRTAIALRYVADLPQADIAAAMGVAPGTVAALLHQARTNLRQTLGGPDHG